MCDGGGGRKLSSEGKLLMYVCFGFCLRSNFQSSAMFDVTETTTDAEGGSSESTLGSSVTACKKVHNSVCVCVCVCGGVCTVRPSMYTYVCALRVWLCTHVCVCVFISPQHASTQTGCCGGPLAAPIPDRVC